MFEMLDLNRMLDKDMKSQAAIIDEYKRVITEKSNAIGLHKTEKDIQRFVDDMF